MKYVLTVEEHHTIDVLLIDQNITTQHILTITEPTVINTITSDTVNTTISKHNYLVKLTQANHIPTVLAIPLEETDTVIYYDILYNPHNVLIDDSVIKYIHNKLLTVG